MEDEKIQLDEEEERIEGLFIDMRRTLDIERDIDLLSRRISVIPHMLLNFWIKIAT